MLQVTEVSYIILKLHKHGRAAKLLLRRGACDAAKCGIHSTSIHFDVCCTPSTDPDRQSLVHTEAMSCIPSILCGARTYISWVVHQEYTRQLGVCLMELQEDSQSPAKQQLDQWVMEVSSLFAATALSSPNDLKQYHLSKMDEGRICCDDELDAALFQGVAVSVLRHSFCRKCQLMSPVM